MSQPPPALDSYIFARNERSAVRLNYQHWLNHQVTGWYIYPALPRHGFRRVADIGGGTGIWAVEVLQQLAADATIDVFDISSMQYPSAGYEPPGIRFLLHDCLMPFDDQYHGQYDFINVRFWLTILNASKLRHMISNLMPLLKPGGYLQWYEPDQETLASVTLPKSFPTPAIDDFIQLQKKPMPQSDVSWVKQLDSFLMEQKLDVLAFERFEIPRYLLPYFKQNHAMAYDEVIQIFEDRGLVERASDARQNCAGVRKEFSQGASIVHDYVCAIARKSGDTTSHLLSNR